MAEPFQEVFTYLFKSEFCVAVITVEMDAH